MAVAGGVSVAFVLACGGGSRPRAVVDGGLDVADGSVIALDDGSTRDPLDPSDASLSLRVGEVFASYRCAGGPETSCHASGVGHLYLDLRPGSGDVVGVPSYERPALLRVERHDPAASYLLLKVTGDGGIDGARMPPGAAYDVRIPSLVRSWIAEGAPSPAVP